MNSTFKTAVFWIVMLCTAILLWKVVNANAGEKVENFPFTRFMTEIDQGNVQEVTITGQAGRRAHRWREVPLGDPQGLSASL